MGACSRRAAAVGGWKIDLDLAAKARSHVGRPQGPMNVRQPIPTKYASWLVGTACPLDM
jgi:hypothetical protein